MCRYILWEAEDKGLLLPYACRMGCCTSCAVRVKSGELHQPQVCNPVPENHPAQFTSTGTLINPELVVS